MTRRASGTPDNLSRIKPPATTLLAVDALAVDNFGVDVKVADQLSEDQPIVWLPGSTGNDAGAVTADVYNHNCLDN